MGAKICKNCFWLRERKSGYWHNGHEDIILVCDRSDIDKKVEGSDSCKEFRSNNLFESINLTVGERR